MPSLVGSEMCIRDSINAEYMGHTENKIDNMRTKTLLLTAALSAAGIATSMAQVYSVNAVGYINKELQPGYNILAAQLIAVDSLGVTNSVNAVIPSTVEGTSLFKFDGQTKTFSEGAMFLNNDPNTGDPKPGWYNGDTGEPSPLKLGLGEGFFINNATPTNFTVTFVGEVPQGDALSLPIYQGGYNLIASIVPQQLYLAPSNSFPVVDGMTYMKFDTVTKQYVNQVMWLSADPNTGDPIPGWYDGDTGEAKPWPQPEVGVSYFINNSTVNNLNWTRSFHVN
eukprot:TRINITY_DN3835_c0_g1_i1.p2 TRINITY_DN3835_c0_g1~~TRINITY_DN3835_c0_g1_i1.p2  ORF type:complete len:281 (-),score=21.31 TRINITY_DN3835_c0_g1_i1:90-932(-)